MSVEALSWAFQQDVTPAARKLVLLALANRADENGCCYPGYKKLAAQCSMARSTVIAHVKALQASGLLLKTGQKRGDGTDTSNLYRLALGGGSEIRTLGSETRTGRVQSSDPNYTNSLNNKKKALPRPDFLREIDAGRLAGRFSEWPHLTESEIVQAADALLDFWSAKGEWPAGDPVSALRSWIRKGIQQGAVRKAPKAARQDEQAAPLDPEIEKWRKRIVPWLKYAGVKWPAEWGPPPHQQGCEAPAEILEQFRSAINERAKKENLVYA